MKNLFILQKRIMIANTPMDYDKIKIYGTKVKVDSMDKVNYYSLKKYKFIF